MILPTDPKKMASLIVVKKPEESPKEAPSEDVDAGLVAAMEEVIGAIEKKDAKAATVALKDFVSMCDQYEDTAESEME
tara:strand:+ start:358 stop:591 length:234 start_codon:yes stop_codon:yes gene_type:complete